MKKEKAKNKGRLNLLKDQQTVEIFGGRLWPIIDFENVFSRIIYGEDMTLLQFIKNKY